MTFKKYCFEDNNEVIEITGGNTIDTSEFAHNENLIHVRIAESIKKIGIGAFRNCVNLRETGLTKGVRIIDEDAYANCKSITEIVIPNGVEIIKNRAFYGCTCVVNISIPYSVREIGSGAFYGTIPNTLFVDANNPCFRVTNNCLIEKKSNALLATGPKEPVIVPYGVEEIRSYAFGTIKSVFLPETIEYMSAYALWWKNIKSLYLGYHDPNKAYYTCIKRYLDEFNVLGEDLEDILAKTIKLYVPFGTYELDRKNRFWGLFKSISEHSGLSGTNKTLSFF